jgi:small conductance mechanosensitive channel
MFLQIDIANYTDKAVELGMQYIPKVLLALLTLVIGFWIIKRLVKLVEQVILNRNLDESLGNFLSSIAGIAMKVMLLISVASMFGINTTSFIAIFSALTVGIGMALNGSIGHFASGVMLMIFKPFKVDDLVEIGGGYVGTVESITAFNTVLKTLDNKRIIIANSNVTGETITNISGQGTVGVEMTFGIGYNDSIDAARRIIMEVGNSCEYILDDPKQTVVVGELADSSVNLNTRPFCKSEHYWDTLFYMQEHVKKEFDSQGISIPFPQMDLNMVKPTSDN